MSAQNSTNELTRKAALLPQGLCLLITLQL